MELGTWCCDRCFSRCSYLYNREFPAFLLIILMNKNNQTYIFSALIFLGASFLIIVSEESVFMNLDSLVGFLLIIQSSFILNYIGIFIFQNVAFMERTAELSYYKKQLPKIQTLSYLMALSFFYCSFVHGFNCSPDNGLLDSDDCCNPGLFCQCSHIKVNGGRTTDKGLSF